MINTDPFGGRAIGSREMLDIREAEYGGEMLYINKSEHHPMWATEYCRDEGLRKYWDEYSYPFHKEGDGPLHRNHHATDYNHNQDMLAIAMIRCWYVIGVSVQGQVAESVPEGPKSFSRIPTHTTVVKKTIAEVE